jgi:hypothetical protein
MAGDGSGGGCGLTQAPVERPSCQEQAVPEASGSPPAGPSPVATGTFDARDAAGVSCFERRADVSFLEETAADWRVGPSSGPPTAASCIDEGLNSLRETPLGPPVR